MKNTFLSRFTPSSMTAETLEAIFVQRHELVKDLIEVIRESALTKNKHFRLLVGGRGMGKTHIISLIYHRLSAMDDLKDKLVIAWMREEEWGIASFLDLLLRIFRALEQEYPEEYNARLEQEIQLLYQMSADVAEHKAGKLLREFVGDRTLLLLMENLDDTFSGLGDIGQKQFRAYIQNYSFITILATSQRLFNGVKQKDAAFYGFFYPQDLEQLEFDEVVDLLERIARVQGDKDLESFIKSPTGRDRIKAIHHLAGGNHRVYIIFAEFLTRKSLDELVEPFMQTLDELTPYYQARMQSLSPQQRKIIDCLCDRRHPVTVKEIATYCFISHQTASSQLKDLRNKGYVQVEAIGRESFYDLQEVLIRHCLNVKKQRGKPISLFVNFLRCWYTKDELKQRLNRLNLEVHVIKNDWNFSKPSDRISVKLEQKQSLEQIDNVFKQENDPYVLEREYIKLALQKNDEKEQDPRISAYRQEYKSGLKKAKSFQDLEKALKHFEKLATLKEDALDREKELIKFVDKVTEIVPNSYQDWITRAEVLINAQRYDDALAAYDQAIKLEPNYALAWNNRGDVLDKLQRYEKAIAAYDKAIELEPNYAGAWGSKGWSLSQLERYDDALTAYDQAIELEPNYAWAWLSKGVVFDKLQRYEEAIFSYEKAIELEPDYAGVWNDRGCLLGNLGDYEKALESLNQAIKIDPHDASAWSNRGVCLRRLERYEEASNSLNQAIKIDPNQASFWNNWGVIYQYLEKYQQALKCHKKAILLEPFNLLAWNNQGDVLDKLQRYKDAIAAYDKAIELEPNYAWAWGSKGWSLSQLERYDEALAAYDQAIKLEPNYAWAWNNQGGVLDKLQRYEDAIAAYDKAIELEPNYAWAWGSKGWSLSQLERYDEALAAYDQAIKLEPNYAWAWNNQGGVLDKLQRYEDAIAAYDKAIELEPNYAGAWGSKGWSLSQLERYDEALAVYDQAIELEPNYAGAWGSKGWSLSQLERYDEALVAYDQAIKLEPCYVWAWTNRGEVLDKLQCYEEAISSYEKAIEFEPNYDWEWANRGWLQIKLERYNEALESCDRAISLGEEHSSVFFNRAISLLALTRWDEGINTLKDVLDRLTEGEKPASEDIEIIIRNLFSNTQNQKHWQSQIKTLLEIFDRYKVTSVLRQAITKTIPILMPEMISDKAAQTWLEIWQELTGDRPEFQIPLRLLKTAVRYKQTKGDRRVLLELAVEERNLLEPLLALQN